MQPIISANVFSRYLSGFSIRHLRLPYCNTRFSLWKMSFGYKIQNHGVFLHSFIGKSHSTMNNRIKGIAGMEKHP